jgi:hypothetical protein
VEFLQVLADAVPGVAGGGREVFPELFERTCGPVAGPAGMAAPAGPLVDLPDSAENAAEFGYAGSRDNRSAFPKARVVALAECGAHALGNAEVGAYAVGEKTLAQRLYPRRRGDELLTGDRGFYSWDAWGTAQAIGAALLWRAPTQLELPVLRVLGDGIYLTVLIKPSVRGRRREWLLGAARDGARPDWHQHGPGRVRRARATGRPPRLGSSSTVSRTGWATAPAR